MANRFPLKLNYLRKARPGRRPTGREPVAVGLPFPRGALVEPFDLAVDEGTGALQSVSTRVSDRWSDGSVRWMLLEWFADSEVTSAWLLESPFEPSGMVMRSPEIRVEDKPGIGLFVDTGGVAVVFEGGVGNLFRGHDQRQPIHVLLRGSGTALLPGRAVVEVEEVGPIRAIVRVKWDLGTSRGRRLAQIQARCHFFAGSAAVRLEITVHNPQAADHPGGIWTLGSKGALLLEELSLVVPFEATSLAGVECSTEVGHEVERFEVPFSLLQASSGGLNWDSRNHIDSGGTVRLAYRGYRASSGQETREGQRATPIVAVKTPNGWFGFAMQYFWENFPKSIAVDQDRLQIGLFPRIDGQHHELQGGEQKTDSLVLWLGDESSNVPDSLEWGRCPLVVSAEPGWYGDSQATSFLMPAEKDTHRGYQSLVELALDQSVGFVAKREVVDEYGWRHFGDLYADHESAFHEGSGIFLSHYNNQYDAVAGFATQFFRDGRIEWYHLMDELARHVVDIDLYHTDEDKSTYNKGQFWHTIHYIDAGLSNHRAYPPADGVNGGGPSTGNMYSYGLLLHYYMTGSAHSREAVLSLGQYVIDADDGSKTIFRFLDRGHTGHVSESGFDQFHGPGRSPANAISTLLDAYRLSGESRYLEKSEQLIRRCIHPDDDIGSRDLLDAENRWFYLMFMQSLGKYLLLKSERGQMDYMYHYARQALLRYALWALEHERPFLDRAEDLEFPTETWAAQDMRKCEMLNLASLFAESGDAVRMRERARYFFDRSVEKLQGADTKSFCRPLVLLLSNGVSQACFEEGPLPVVTANRSEDFDFGKPEQFETQKRRALKRAKVVTGVMVTAGILTLVAWFLISV